MRAVGYRTSLPITEPESLVDLDLPQPEPGPRDLLVKVEAISVNPVDTKVRMRAAPEAGGVKVLGWDAAGTVVALGAQAEGFAVGDAVFYAGDLTRPGTNAAYHCVDARLVGHKPACLDWAQAAALPLTAITAWETLFDRLDVAKLGTGKLGTGKLGTGESGTGESGTGKPVPGAAPAILIVGGAGGVGSVAIQLARALTDLTVIATASRPETASWCRDLGAHHVVDHARPLAAGVAALGLGAPGLVFSTTNTDSHLAEIADLIAPQGRLALIDDPAQLDIALLKRKSLSLHWEFMFTRSMFATPDIGRQGALLDAVARLIDAGHLRTTLGEHYGRIDAQNLRRAHALIESGRAKGKIVLAGFSD